LHCLRRGQDVADAVQRKPGRFLADTPRSGALWPEGRGAAWSLICPAHSMLAALKAFVAHYPSSLNPHHGFKKKADGVRCPAPAAAGFGGAWWPGAAGIA
jgi:hypothetical protein